MNCSSQVDPIPGGNANAYVYAVDPINTNDYSGLCLLQCAAGAGFYQPAAPAPRIQPSVGYTAYSAPSRANITVARNPAPAPAPARVRGGVAPLAVPAAGAYLTNAAKAYQSANYVAGDGRFNNYVNIGVGGGLKIGPLTVVPGGAIGLKISPDSGFHPYITACSTSAGVGGSVSVGSGQIISGWNKEVSAYLGPGGSIDDNGGEIGFGTPGFCAGFTHTW